LDEIAIADRTALLDLISAYSHAWDGRDQDRWVNLFTDDAILEASFRGKLAWTYASNRERSQFIWSFWAGAGEIGILQSRHFQTNTLFVPQSDGSVHADTMFAVVFQHAGEPAPRFSNTGIYRDRFVKRENGWRFARRDIFVDQDPPPTP
jgi:3-phenylpropionate/cinnamic acid dioxygenase small subunit